MNLTDFEKEVLGLAIGTEVPELIGQIKNLRIRNREWTGVGVFVYFDNPEDPSNEVELRALGNNIIGERDDLPDVLRFVVEVKFDKIESLEIFANSGDWFPDCLGGIRLSFLSGS
jgi:tagatose-1,6-bisphosphate aldolase